MARCLATLCRGLGLRHSRWRIRRSTRIGGIATDHGATARTAPPHTRVVSVNRQYHDNRLTGRYLKSVPLRVTARVIPPTKLRQNLISGRQCEPSVPRQPAYGPQLEVSAPSGHGPRRFAEIRPKLEIGPAHRPAVT